jgi:hypothetical protein
MSGIQKHFLGQSAYTLAAISNELLRHPLVAVNNKYWTYDTIFIQFYTSYIFWIDT